MKNYNLNEREGRQAFYRSPEWRCLRDYILSKKPLCDYCLKRDRITPAECVDHKIDIKIRPDLRLDMNNLQTLCHNCHSKKTAQDQSGSEKSFEPVNKKFEIKPKKL